MTSKTSTSRLQIACSILFLALSFFAMAQEALPNGTNNTSDVVVASIDDYLPITLLLGIYVVYRFLKPTINAKQLNN